MNNSLPPADAAVPAGSIQLGHYELLNCIGRGGMGLVYRARDTKLEREVAVKCLRTELFEDHYTERFKREALLLAKLNHPNIVQIYDFIVTPEQVALVMELVDGQNLQTYLREHLAPIAQRLQWLAQIAEGLAVAHDAGIIHRDLKTENILINKRGQAKITDLGIAKSQDFNATLTDHVAGSYCSMSPEQAMGEAITFKSDLFSLGILAYQLLCGAHPFGDTSNKLQTMQRIISHPPTAPQKYNPDLPAEFIDLLGQLLSKDPDKRPDNTHWVAAQFEKLKALSWQENTQSDDTQALIVPLSPTATKASHTQDHPTFDTRFVAMPITPKASAWQKLKSYIAANKITLSSAAISLLIIATVIMWQLQPKPPKYVAVIPPKLTAVGMQVSQQDLVKGAVHDAIQQSVIQLDGYYLIPQNEILDVNGDNETVHRATNADELITTDIKCKIETCEIILSRLQPESNEPNSRLRVKNTKTIDILTDNFLSIAEIVYNNVDNIYGQKKLNIFSKITEQAYSSFLESSAKYKVQGASDTLLSELENLEYNAKKTSSVQNLYKDVALDLFYESKNKNTLIRLEDFIRISSSTEPSPSQLFNSYYLQLAQRDFASAEKTIELIKNKNISNSSINELQGYAMMETADYEKATVFFKRALTAKPTATNLFNTANALWHSGDSKGATEYLYKVRAISPEHYKANSLSGILSMLEGDIDTAIAALEKAVKKNPNDIGNLNNLGICFMLNKSYKKAYDIFEKAAMLSPNNTTIMLNKADSKNLGGDIVESHALYRKIIFLASQEKETKETLRNTSQSYAHLGLFSEAFTALQLLEKNDPQNIETIYTATLVHSLAKNNAAAIFSAEKALQSGMNYLWFSPSWFDHLCSDEKFSTLIKKMGAPQRCSH